MSGLVIWLLGSIVVSTLVSLAIKFYERRKSPKKFGDADEKQAVAIGVGLLWPMFLVMSPFAITGAGMYFINKRIMEGKP